MQKPLSGRRVLIVEDDVLLLMNLQDMLDEFGCIVVGTAMTVVKALPLARSLALDLAVLDVNLGGELVTPVAEALASRFVPFLFATGYDAQIVGTLSGHPRLPKPYRSDDLLHACQRRSKNASAGRSKNASRLMA